MVDNDLMVVLNSGQEPGPGAPVPRLRPRGEERDRELRLDRLPAAAAQHRPGAAGRAGVRAAQPALGRGARGVLHDRLPAARARRPRSTPPGTRSGKSSRPVPDTPSGQRVRLLWPLLAAARHRVDGAAVRHAAVRRAGHRVRSDRPGLPLAAARPGCPGSGTSPSSTSSSTTSSARTGTSARRWSAPACTWRWPAALCVLIAYPVAYYTARCAGRYKALILTLLIAPFWITYMMRPARWCREPRVLRGLCAI